MIFKNLCNLVLIMKVDSALEGFLTLAVGMFRRPEYNYAASPLLQVFRENGRVHLFGVCVLNRRNIVIKKFTWK